MNCNEKEMYDFAYGITCAAGDILRFGCKNSIIEIKEKTSQMDIVTQYDILIEKYLTERILGRYPEHTILAEECYNTNSITTNGYTWIIDPIDGTVNYYRFSKDYAISIALYNGKVPIFGLVYDVANDNIFSANNAENISMDGNCLNHMLDNETSISKAIIGMSFRTIKELTNMGTDVLGLLSKVQAHRYLGCASLELCKIAKGEYDLFISSNVYTWDIAAARIIIEQCGGFLISCEKENNTSHHEKLFVSAFRSPKLWEETLELLPSNVKTAFGY